MRHSSSHSVLALMIVPMLIVQIPLQHAVSQLAPAVPSTTTVAYMSTSAVLPDPERGFYHYTETHSNGYEALDLATLQSYRQDEGITLIQRMFYLEDFIASDISATYLADMQADFDTVRAAGLKMIVRFAYAEDLPPTPPYSDAPKAQILRHLEQVRPILQANSDVIAAMQAGFIGVWGEWVYTDYFVEDPSNPDQVTEKDWANRREVLTNILQALPATRMTQVRTPLIKQKIFDRISPITLAEAYSGSNVARTGQHNDCFLASDTDSGTYRTELITDEKAYLAEETKAVPMGGETCALNPPRSECPTATAELSRFHWSYLNKDYHPDVLGSWNTICFDDIQRRLGYRLALLEGTYADEVQLGASFSIDIAMRNEGWAAPYNPRLVELLLRHTTSGAIYRVKLPDDPRFWLPERGIISLKHTICTSTNLPLGQYELLLNLPDPETSLYARPAYSIRLANQLVWEESTGYNKLLHTITVMKPSRSTVAHSSAMAEVCNANVYLPMLRKP